MRKSFCLLFLAMLLAAIFPLFTACTQDAYSKGEGEYSLMRGDFAEVHVNAAMEMESITTDDGDVLPLKEPLSLNWVTTADTTYRCLLYYNKVKDEAGRARADVLSVGLVPCPSIVSLSDLDKDLKTDPVKFESIWMSKSRKYLNMSLYVMTGHTDDTTAVHRLSFVSDTLMAHPDSTRTLHVLLHHDQNNVPAYYSTQIYVSLLVDSIPADSISLTVNSYNGLVQKQFFLR